MSDDTPQNSCFSAADICKIVRECSKSGVRSFEFSGFKVIFDLGESRGKENRELASEFGYNNNGAHPTQSDISQVASQSSGETPFVESQPHVDNKEVIETVEKILHDEVQLNLPIESPLEWEEAALKEFESAEESQYRGIIEEIS